MVYLYHLINCGTFIINSLVTVDTTAITVFVGIFAGIIGIIAGFITIKGKTIDKKADKKDVEKDINNLKTYVDSGNKSLIGMITENKTYNEREHDEIRRTNSAMIEGIMKSMDGMDKKLNILIERGINGTK